MYDDEGEPKEDEFQTIKETAEDLHISTGKLRQWIRDDLIKAIKPSGKKHGVVRISVQEIKAFIEKHIRHEEGNQDG